MHGDSSYGCISRGILAGALDQSVLLQVAEFSDTDVRWSAHRVPLQSLLIKLTGQRALDQQLLRRVSGGLSWIVALYSNYVPLRSEESTSALVCRDT
jgi:hypothetical protein